MLQAQVLVVNGVQDHRGHRLSVTFHDNGVAIFESTWAQTQRAVYQVLRQQSMARVVLQFNTYVIEYLDLLFTTKESGEFFYRAANRTTFAGTFSF